MRSCCLGISNGDQISVVLEPIDLCYSEDTKLSTSLQEFSQFLESHLDWQHKNIDSNGNLIPPVSLQFSEDAGLLQCEKPKYVESDALSLLGILENQSLYVRSPADEANRSEEEIDVIVEAYRPSNEKITSKGCNCLHPVYDWRRSIRNEVKEQNRSARFCDSPCLGRIKMFDFSELQLARRGKGHDSKSDVHYPRFDHPGSVCHLLRSVLTCGEHGTSSSCSKYGSHCASPWRDYCVPRVAGNDQNENTSSSENECDYMDQVICVIFCNQIDGRNENPHWGERFWDDLEERELREFMNFRTSDACPNFIFILFQI
jgi:hypothetical protein